MRIHTIRVHNLTSLHGTTAEKPHVLDLDGDLGAAPLFLIRGPTGAGKSTLLDAITLALFGRTARLKSTTGTAADETELDDADARRVLAHACGDGYAEVDFSFARPTGRVAYRARWTVRRARNKANGQLQKPVRSLWRLERPGGAEIEVLVSSDKKNDIDAAFSTVLSGLGYEDFTRSVMLAQGDFQAFLKADDAQRAALLARLTDASVYVRLGRAAAERRRQSKQRVVELQAKVAAASCLDDAARTALESALADARSAAELHRHEVQQLDAQRAAASELGRTLAALEAARAGRVAHEAAVSAHAGDAARLARHQAAEQVWAVVAAADAAAREVETRRAVLRGLEAELPEAEVARGETEGALRAAEQAFQLVSERSQALRGPIQAAREAGLRRAEAERKVVQAEADKAAVEARVTAETARAEAATEAWREADERVSTLELQRKALGGAGDLEALAARVTDAAGSWRRAAKASAEATRAKEQAVVGVRARQAELEGARAAAAEAERVAEAATGGVREAEVALGAMVADAHVDGALKDAEARVESARRGISSSNEMLKPIGEREKYRVALARLEQEHAAAREAADMAHRAVEMAEQQRHQAEVDLEKWRRDLEAAERVREIVRRRAVLVADEPCPLCGGTDHPYRRDPSRAPSTAAQDALVVALEADGKAHRGAVEAAKKAVREAQEGRELAVKRAGELAVRVENGRTAIAGLDSRIETWLGGLRDAGIVDATIAVAMVDAAMHGQVVALLQEQLRLGVTALDGLREALRRLDAAVTAAQLAALGARHTREAVVLAERAQADAEAQLGAALEREVQAGAETERAWQSAVAHLREAGQGLAEDATADEVGAAVEAVMARAAAWRKVRDAHEVAQQALAERLVARDVAVEAREAARLAVAPAVERLGAARAELTVAEGALDAAMAELGGEAPDALQLRLDEELKLSRTAEAACRERAQQAVARAESVRTLLDGARGEFGRADALCKDAAAACAAALAAGGWEDGTSVRAARLGDAEAGRLRAAAQALDEREVATQTALELALGAYRQAVVKAEVFAGGAGGEGEIAWERLIEDGVAVEAWVGRSNDMRGVAQNALEAARAAEGAHHAALEQDERNRAAGREHAAALAAARIEDGHWELIHKLIGERDGEAFVKVAQAFHLADLCQRANARLKRLSPRYRLSVKRETSGLPTLSFLVLDADQADRARPPSTLSGGETFIVSLALALALADFRAADVPIETVLIDEGFGTLDPQTLGTVIATLESLHAATGSQIGIISHVAMLAERIPARVHVKPVGQGRSELVVER